MAETSFYKLGVLAVMNSVAVLASLVFILTRAGELGNLTLAGVYFASALPFFFSGAVVSIAVAEAIQRVDRVYFFDLLGAAGGCLVLVPFLNYFGGPNTVIAVSVLLAVSAAIWYNLAGTLARPRRRRDVGAGVRGADGFQREEPPDRYSLRQGPSHWAGSVRAMESDLAHRAGESQHRAIRRS